MTDESTASLHVTLPDPDANAIAAARARQLVLTKPTGALGRLEELSIQLAGITGEPQPSVQRPVVVVAAASHGVAAQGVSAYPSEVTAQMVANFRSGGAAINVLSRAAGAELVLVDAGVEPAPPAGDDLVDARIAPGSGDLSEGPAMTRAQAAEALRRGRALAAELCEGGSDLIALGEMGIGNTTPAACILSAVSGASAEVSVGRGTGVDDAGLARKRAVVERALALHALDRTDGSVDGVALLAAVGGLEIGVLAGVALGAAERRRPVLLDGFITTAAALVADRLATGLRPFLIASHRSAEAAHGLALDHLGLRPLLELELRLGEGSGAALALPLVRAAALTLSEMATFDEAAVSDRA